jgi:hypothetical protein
VPTCQLSRQRNVNNCAPSHLTSLYLAGECGVGAGKCPVNATTAGNGLSKCSGCWGKSLAMAGKSWGAADIGTRPSINNSHMNHRGTSPIGGGDWGITACPHPECVSNTWCLQNNLLAKCKACTSGK